MLMEETNNLLKEILKVQQEQRDYLKKNLTRIQFSLWTLLLLTTVTCVALGIGGYYFQRPIILPPPTAFTIQAQPALNFPNPAPPPTPVPDEGTPN